MLGSGQHEHAHERRRPRRGAGPSGQARSLGRARSPGLRGTERSAGERGQLANDGEAVRVGERGGPVRSCGLGGHRVVPFNVVATTRLSHSASAAFRRLAGVCRCGLRALGWGHPYPGRPAATRCRRPSKDLTTPRRRRAHTGQYRRVRAACDAHQARCRHRLAARRATHNPRFSFSTDRVLTCVQRATRGPLQARRSTAMRSDHVPAARVTRHRPTA